MLVLRWRRGFSLLELLIALAVLATLIAVAAPLLIRPAGVELRSAAQTVATGLRQARLEAIQRQRSVALQLNLDARTLRLERGTKEHRLPKDLNIELFTAEREMLSPGLGGIRFFPDGSSTGGRVTLTLQELVTLVDVEWLTGRIRILEKDS
jgi:general secretion pathway protein H